MLPVALEDGSFKIPHRYIVIRVFAQRLIMLYRCFALFLLFISTNVLADLEKAQPDAPYGVIKYQTPDGVILVDADTDWNRLKNVQLRRGTVEFTESWVSDQEARNKIVITQADLERIKTDMADLLERVLISELSDREAYTLTGESGADTLRFTPNIVNLDIYTPGGLRGFVGQQLTNAQGNMVLVLEINDSVSGKLLATAVQKQHDADRSYWDSTNRGSNQTAFRRMMESWTDWLFAMLEEVKTGNLD